MQNLRILAVSSLFCAVACVDGNASEASFQPTTGTDYSGAASAGTTSTAAGAGGSSGASVSAGAGGTAAGPGGAPSSAAGNAAVAGSNSGGLGGMSMGGTSMGDSGSGNVPIEGGSGSTETNPGKGNGFFPATLLPSHAKAAYTTWKSKYLKSCDGGRFRVASNGDETVSEGIGYGMLLTVAHGDRAEFDGLWSYYKDHSSGGLMGWKVSGCGGTVDGNSATDADLDAAMALIQASCKWGGSYSSDAQGLIGAIKSKETIEGGEDFLKPAASGLDGCQNVSYAAPAYYRAFATKVPDQAGFWSKLAQDSYTQLGRTQNASTGLVPNWSNMGGSPGCAGKPNGDRYGYDAARSPWRVATDYVWNGTPAAKDWLGKLVTWVDGPAGGITAIGDMYQLSGTKEGSNHNSTFTGAFALAAMSQSQAKADVYGTAFRAISDSAYFEESLRAVYMLLAAGLFAPACN